MTRERARRHREFVGQQCDAGRPRQRRLDALRQQANERAAVGHHRRHREQALGDRFVARVLPDESASRTGLPPFFEHVIKGAHSVVTVHLIDEAGQPTLAARDEILAFFARCLAPA